MDESIPYGYCHCGCGERTKPAYETKRDRGWVKGQPLKWVRGHQKRGPRMRGRTIDYTIEDRGYDTPCWVYQGTRDPDGYGAKTVEGVSWKAHRWYYEQSNGPIPEGLEPDHLCRVPSCVNPDHIEPVTRSINILRGDRHNKPPKDEFGRKVWEARRARDLTQKALADLAGMSPTTVSRVEKANRVTTADTKQRLRRLLGI